MFKRSRALIPALLLAWLVVFGSAHAQTCVPKPAGSVVWWPGEGNAADVQGTNNGTLMNGATFAAGKVGQAFSFDGVDDYMVVPDSEAQKPTNITIEGWFKVLQSLNAGQEFVLVSKYGNGFAGWIVYVHEALQPIFVLHRELERTNASATSSASIPVGQWTHLACTYDGTNAKIYVNGALQGTASFPGGYTPSTIPLTMGKASWCSLCDGSFAPEQVDELSIYNRALTETEINSIYAAGSAGKCKSPLITAQPVSQLVLPGTNVTFTVGATGLGSLSYQWRFNETNLPGKTSFSLLLTNASLADVGAYSVLVSNAYGSVLSSNAFLVLLDSQDDDFDGLPNQWEVFYGLNPTNSLDAATHPPGDQLTYLQKYLYGLNPLTPDTDGDGLSDYDELFVYGTNPLKADTDGDGIPDGWEVQHGLNPRFNDAADDLDGDGLSNLAEYNWSLSHPNQLVDPRTRYSTSTTMSDFAVVTGTGTNQFFYDRNNRLIGAEFDRGLGLAYVYDGNDNLVRQVSMKHDANTNGLPDVWEFLNGLTNNTTAFTDTDGDGWTDYQEWKAGSNPTDSNSVPGPTCVTPPAGLVAWWPGEGNANDIQGTNNGTLMNGATFASGKVGQAFSFDGVDDYVVVPNSEAQRPTNITIEGWFKVLQVPNGVQDFVLVAKYFGYAGWIVSLGTDLKPHFRLHRQPNFSSDDAVSSVSISVGQWTHLACTYDGANAKLYVNGALQGTTSFPGGYTPSTSALTMGRASWYGGGYAPEQVDEFSIYNRALTETEINSIYAAGSAGKCTLGAQTVPQTVPQTAPAAAVLPSTNSLGNFALLTIRLWDAEGNSSTPFLQYQLDNTINWQDATLAYLDGAPYSTNNRVAALPGGTNHTLVWNALTNLGLGVNTNILLRARARDIPLLGNWSAGTPFTVQTTANPDADGNGLPDWWEIQNFGHTGVNPNDDPDGDGFSNLQEYIADTNPTNSLSYLHINGVQPVPGGVWIQWQGGTWATQSLQRAFALGGTNQWLNIFTASPPTPLSGSFTDFSGTNAMQFYRIKATR